MLIPIAGDIWRVGDYTWKSCSVSVPTRAPGKGLPNSYAGRSLELHRRYGGLLHRISKRPHADEAIKKLLDELDMWDHICCNMDHGGVLLKDPRLKAVAIKGPLPRPRRSLSRGIAAVLRWRRPHRRRSSAANRHWGVTAQYLKTLFPRKSLRLTIPGVRRKQRSWQCFGTVKTGTIAQTEEEQRRSGLKITTRACR
jgi:hypothetical protein